MENNMQKRRHCYDFIMPVYNEEEHVEQEINDLTDFLRSLDIDFHILVVENGSTDRTPDILDRMSRDRDELTVSHVQAANIGRAKKLGLLSLSHDRTFIVHLDFWDRDFIRRSLDLLDKFPLIQSSKRHPDSHDRRSGFRRLLTWGYNLLLQWLVGYRGTDSRGIKALRRKRLLPIIERCVTERGMFESELVIRCQKEGIPVKELPVTVPDKRSSRNYMIKKISQNILDLVQITLIIRREY